MDQSGMSLQTTVVFADLFGSTRVFEALGNVKATQAVTQITAWITKIVETHGGRVVKTLGDGVLALFDDSRVAINAVVAMQRNHKNNMTQMPLASRLPIRIGVASGEVEIVDRDCYGDAVNVAARLSDLSGPQQIWVNAAALEDVHEEDGVRFRLLGPINIRGRAEPCTVFQVDWQEDVASDFLTMQAELDPSLEFGKKDILGGEIELSLLDSRKLFRSFELPIHIGRIRQAEFSVADPRVSRTHARVDWRKGSVILVDLSSYGCWVRFSGGGADLLLRLDECVLHGRGEIALGSSFSDVSAPVVSFSVS